MQKIGKRSSRVTIACERCRKKKVKCDSKRPCFNCIASQSKCVYKGLPYQPSERLVKYAGSFVSDMDEIKRTVTKLKNQLSPNAPTSLQKTLFVIDSELEQTQTHLYLELDSKEIGSYSGTKSIETEIIGKQSRSISKFSNSFENTAALNVDLYFGLYSPLLYFTSTGISWIIKTLFSYTDDSTTRETVFLLLKYIDVSSVNYLSSVEVTTISPFERYAKLNNLHCGNEKLLQHILSDISSFLDNNTSILKAADYRSPINGLMNAILLMGEHHKKLNAMSIDLLLVRSFLEQDNVISCLCLEYVQKSMFSQMYEIRILQGLTSLIEYRYWIDDFFALGRVICMMTRRGLDAGLNRWEYYIGQSEDTAEKYRTLWWGLYWWDRWYALVTGKQPLIPEEVSSCLFPKDVMALGVDDSMDCFTLIDLVEFDPLKIDACVLFGYIFLAKLITVVYFRLLYNRNFTDYKLFVLPTKIELKIIARKLEMEFMKINKAFERAQEKLLPFLRDHSDNNCIFDLYVHLGFAQVCCFQAIESLMTRIQTLLQGEEETALVMCMKQLRLHSYEISATFLTTLSKQKSSFRVFKCSWCVYVIVLSFVSHFIENLKNGTLRHLSLICGTVSLYANLLSSYDCTEFKGNNNFYERLGNGTTILFILARVCCQVYVRSHNTTNKLLIKSLEKYGQSFADAALMVLDIECSWYKDLISNHSKSDYREKILSILGKKMDDFANGQDANSHNKNSFYDKLPLSNTGGPEIVDYGSLENFVTLECLPELFGILLDRDGEFHSFEQTTTEE
ncbi:CQS_1a_G0057260.mRNA.1.CDS.1 [Saccharomyces cerevisiae]|nr:CQS_1a_G0057260.mRNA.1.CDS.1 [Saccharomyces cerevisiae]CAI7489659.1 CQS_1a_G0057260.mRNA.1.CDS.1 [Saccharomyces cerevisiae]